MNLFNLLIRNQKNRELADEYEYVFECSNDNVRVQFTFYMKINDVQQNIMRTLSLVVYHDETKEFLGRGYIRLIHLNKYIVKEFKQIAFSQEDFDFVENLLNLIQQGCFIDEKFDKISNDYHERWILTRGI